MALFDWIERSREQQVREQIEMIRVTSELGGGFCRTLSGQNRPEVPPEQAMGWAIECIQACLCAAEEAGIKLVIENHYKDSFWTRSDASWDKRSAPLVCQAG